jgi:hypothetical protein
MKLGQLVNENLQSSFILLSSTYFQEKLECFVEVTFMNHGSLVLQDWYNFLIGNYCPINLISFILNLLQCIGSGD